MATAIAAHGDVGGRERRRMFWKAYVTDPSPDMDPEALVTELTWTIPPAAKPAP